MNKEYNDVFTGRAILDLHGFFVITSQNDIVDNPKIIFRSLRSDELYLLSYIEQLGFDERATVYEELVRDNVIEIFGYRGMSVNLTYSPAGVIDMIAEAVLQLTYDYLVNKDNQKFEKALETTTFLESMQAIIAHYLNIPYLTVAEMPVQEVFSKYALCCKTFPNQVQPLERKEGE